MLPRLFSPRPPHGAELWLAESLQCPTLTDPTARGSSNALLLQFLYIWGKKPHLLPSGTQKDRLRDKFVSVLCCCKFHFSCPNWTSVLSSSYFWYLLTWYCLQLELPDNDRFDRSCQFDVALTRQMSLQVCRVKLGGRCLGSSLFLWKTKYPHLQPFKVGQRVLLGIHRVPILPELSPLDSLGWMIHV